MPADTYPLAYFLTWTTYGTWLHGEARGQGSVDRHHNDFGTAFVSPNAGMQHAAAARMTHPAYTLDASARCIVLAALQALAREKIWTLHAAHIRSNHIHLVMTAPREPGRLMSDLKARASRDLSRSGDSSAKRWTRHGSTRHLFTEESRDRAVRYTLHEQGVPLCCYPDPRKDEPRTK